MEGDPINTPRALGDEDREEKAADEGSFSNLPDALQVTGASAHLGDLGIREEHLLL